MNNNATDNPAIQNLFAEVLEELETEEKTETTSATDTFRNLPDGTYRGKVAITVDSVKNQTSANYGRSKFVIELTVIEEPFVGKTAFHHRVIYPTYLLDKEKEAKAYFRQTLLILKNCGVNTQTKTLDELYSNLVANNRRRPTVEFTVKNSTPYIEKCLTPESSGTTPLIDLSQLGTNVSL